jgi:CRP/FNR family transcriptional regulator, cyclic AMP receptor protein
MSAKPCNIVCIEDEDEIRQTIAEVLQDEGYTVETAANGRDGLALALEKRPDLIICDIYMPHLDGFAVCREFHAANAENQHVPFIFLSALPQDDEKLKRQRVVFDAYLTKPVDFDQLLAKIAELTCPPVRGEGP